MIPLTMYDIIFLIYYDDICIYINNRQLDIKIETKRQFLMK